jgi:hypothetical protein
MIMVLQAKVEGEQRTIMLLQKFDKQAYDEISKGFKKAGEKVRDEARLQTPPGNALSNWGRWIAVDRGRDLGFSGTRVRSKIKVSLSQDRRKWGYNLYFVKIVTMDWGGAVFSLAGTNEVKKRSTNRNPKGRTFAANLGNKYGGRPGTARGPRGLLYAVMTKGPDARKDLERVMDQATAYADRLINRGQ